MNNNNRPDLIITSTNYYQSIYSKSDYLLIAKRIAVRLKIKRNLKGRNTQSQWEHK